MAGGHSSEDDESAAELLSEVAEELREQATQEANHFYVSVKKLRLFARVESPPETLNVSAILCADHRFASTTTVDQE
jgi:hypothetical protein